MSNKDCQIIAQILKYCAKIECTVKRFGADPAVFIADPDYRDSIAMNLLQIGELAGKLSPDYVLSSVQNWRAIKNMRKQKKLDLITLSSLKYNTDKKTEPAKGINAPKGIDPSDQSHRGDNQCLYHITVQAE